MDTACSSCGAAMPGGARFCPGCGRSISESARLPAERRPVTVLFADAVGSTAFTEREGDEAAYRFVQTAVARMSDAIERHGGTVTQFRGDGVMALFGAPLAQEHSAVEAVTAALEIQAALHELRDRCEFRLGLSTGPVVVGHVGDDVLLDYTAIGDTANVAARMEQCATPGAVFVSASTWRAVRPFVECRSVGDLEVRGKQEPIAAYEALRRLPVRTRLDAAVERGLGRFVGRSRELDLLLGVIDDLPDGHGHVVELTGEAGIGKSRLLLELRRHLPETVGWLEGHCSAGGENVAYLPIAGLLRNAFGVEEHDDPPAVIRRLEDAVASWPPEAQAVVPYLKFVLDVDPGDTEVEVADPRVRRAGVIDALRIALATAGQRQPRVVVVEDVHWADAASKDALRALGESMPQAGILLMTTSRPGYESAFGPRALHTRMALDALDADDAAEISADVLEVERVPVEIAELIAGRTEGNPLFIEELTATLVESGYIVSQDGACRLAGTASDIDVPGTLQDVILARIDRLERAARDALQLAAVIGREFTVRLLDRLISVPEGLDETLEELKAVELIRQKAWFPELAYLFKHALTHEVTYATLLDERRRELHRLVARAIEEVYADRLAEHVELLAHHWLVAEEWDNALQYLEQAAERARSASANEAAVSFFEQGSTLAERLGNPSLAAALALRTGDVRLDTGDPAAAVVSYERAATLARAAGDIDRLAWALALQGEARGYMHDFEEAQENLLAALDLVDASLAPRQFAVSFLVSFRFVFGHHHESDALQTLSRELMAPGVTDERTAAASWTPSSTIPRWRGDLQTCLDVTDHEPPGNRDLLLTQAFGWTRGLVLGEVGRYDEGRATLIQAVERSERTGELMMRARMLNTIGWIHGDLGDHEGSVEWNRRCLSFLREIHFPDEEIESNAHLNLAETFLDLGRLDDADRHLERVEDIVQGKPLRGTWGLWRFSQRLHLLRSTYDLLREEPADVGPRIADCRALAEASGSRKYLGKAARVNGQLLAARGALDEAAAETDRALEIASTVGHPPEMWRSHTQLAGIASGRGDLDLARHHLVEADHLLAALDLRNPALRAGVARLRQSLHHQQ